MLLLLQTPRCGNKPSAEVLLLQVRFRDDVCIFVRAIFFPRGGLMRFILGVAVFGRQIRTMFAACSFIVLCRRGNVVVVSSRVDWSVIFSCVVITIFAMAGLSAAPLTSALGLLPYFLTVGALWPLHQIPVVVSASDSSLLLCSTCY